MSGELFRFLEKPLDLPVVLDLMDRIFSGLLIGMILVPLPSTWSRARCWSKVDREGALEADTVLEVTFWMAQEALRSTTRKVFLVLVLSEDFGGHCVSGPASLLGSVRMSVPSGCR